MSVLRWSTCDLRDGREDFPYPRQHQMEKISASLSNHDIDFFDAYATHHGISSRSGVIHHAVLFLKTTRPAGADADE